MRPCYLTGNTRHRHPKAAGGFPWGRGLGAGQGMDNAFLIIVLAVACISVGIVRIGSWVIAYHEQEQTRVLLQQVYAACAIARARSEGRIDA